MKEKIFRAGLIPYFINDGIIEMMFMKPSNSKYGGDSPQIAKGKVETNETTKEAAIREAQEELGLFPSNINNIENIGKFLGRTTIFIGKITDKELFGDPHFETSEVNWMTLDEFISQGRGLHKPIVKAAARRIEKQLT